MARGKRPGSRLLLSEEVDVDGVSMPSDERRLVSEGIGFGGRLRSGIESWRLIDGGGWGAEDSWRNRGSGRW